MSSPEGGGTPRGAGPGTGPLAGLAVPARQAGLASLPAHARLAGLARLAVPARLAGLTRLAGLGGLGVLCSVQVAALLGDRPTGRALAVVALAAMLAVGVSKAAGAGRGWLAGPGAIGAIATVLLASGVAPGALLPERWPALWQRLAGGWRTVVDSGTWPYRDAPGAAVTVDLLLALAAATALSVLLVVRPCGRRGVLAACLLPVGVFAVAAAQAPGQDQVAEGVLLSLSLCAAVWPADGVRLGGPIALAAAAIGMAAAATAAVPAGGLQSWLSAAATRRSTPRLAESFDWDERFGSLPWRGTRTLLRVTEDQPTLLRAASLDRFDGRGFVRSGAPAGAPGAGLDGRTPGVRWRRQATVFVTGLRSASLPAPGEAVIASSWLSRGDPSVRRTADGNLLVAPQMEPGDLYKVTAYDPTPAPPVLRRAGFGYPRAYLPYVTVELPSADGRVVVRPAAPGLPARLTDRALLGSPYLRAFLLARKLAAGARNSFAVATRVERFLRRGFSYDANVQSAPFPLLSFLFVSRRGYCQQFAGAMALLLRLDGVPARVAAGFKPAVFDSREGSWLVRERDAHMWVEVFFRGIGWVSFDPTPPERQAQPSAATASRVPGRAGRRDPRAVQALVAKGGAGLAEIAAATAAALLALSLGGLLIAGRRRLARALSGQAQGAVGELQRALGALERSPVPPTLARLEAWLDERGEERARAYVRSLRTARFGPDRACAPDAAGRSALRRALASGRGIGGRLLLWRLFPPGWPAAAGEAASGRVPAAVAGTAQARGSCQTDG